MFVKSFLAEKYFLVEKFPDQKNIYCGKLP